MGVLFMNRESNKKGFTLVELLIVISILSFIAAIGINSMKSISDAFKNKADIETSNIIARKIEIEVLAGDIAETTTGITDSEFPKSASSGTDFTADVTFNANGTCTVTVKDGDDFSHDVLIESKAIE